MLNLIFVVGTGKTTAASMIIDRIFTHQGTKSCLLYLYCASSENGFLSLENLIGELWKQVLQSTSVTESKIFRKRYERFTDEITKPTSLELLENLQEEVKAFEKVHVVLDGLDNLEERVERTLLDSIRALHSHTKILLFTSPESTSAQTFEQGSRAVLSLRTSDLEHFVDSYSNSLGGPPTLAALSDAHPGRTYEERRSLLMQKSQNK